MSALADRVRRCSRALSLTQPYAWLVVHRGKDTENRSTGFSHKSFRGDFLVHAAKGMTKADYDTAVSVAFGVLGPGCTVPNMAELDRGGIIGIARVLDIVPPGYSGRRWHFPDQYGFVLADVEPLPFTAWSGNRGFWRVVPLLHSSLLASLETRESAKGGEVDG